MTEIKRLFFSNEDDICTNCKLQNEFPIIHWSKIKCSNYKDTTCPLSYLNLNILTKLDENKNIWTDYEPISKEEYAILRVLLYKLQAKIKNTSDRTEDRKGLDDILSDLHKRLFKNERNPKIVMLVID